MLPVPKRGRENLRDFLKSNFGTSVNSNDLKCLIKIYKATNHLTMMEKSPGGTFYEIKARPPYPYLLLLNIR